MSVLLDVDASALARLFHEEYERLAPAVGYKTRDDSAVPWADVPSTNKNLMIATATAVLERMAVRPVETEATQVMLVLDLLLDVAYHDGGPRDLAVAAEAYSLAGYHDGAIRVSHASAEQARAAVAAARKGRDRRLLKHDAEGMLHTVRTLVHEGVLDGTVAARRKNARWLERGGHAR